MRDLGIAASLAALALGLYAATACRTFYGGDSAELAAAAATFGVPHPPGYPLFVILAGCLVQVLPTDPAFAANLATGGFGALAVGGLFLLARRAGISPLGSVVAAASFSLGRTWWSQCVAAEVYSLDALLLVATLHAAFRPLDRPGRLLLAGGLLGLWLGYRPINVLYFPLVVLVASAYRGASWRDRRSLAWLATGVGLSSAVYLFLPLSSSRDPAIDVGDPETWERFWTVIRGAPYARHWFATPLDVSTGRITDRIAAASVEVGVSGPLSLLGIARAHDLGGATRRIGWAALGIVVVALLVSGAYATLDVAVTFIPAALAMSLLGGIGFDAFRGDRRIVAVGAAVVTIGLGIVNYDANDLSKHRLARWVGERALDAAPRDAILLVHGDTTIHAIWYLRAVEGRRKDLLVVSPGHFRPWYQEQLDREQGDIVWPAGRPAGSDRYVAKWVAANLGRRRVVTTLSLDPTPILSELGERYVTVPHGPLREIAPKERPRDVEAMARQATRLIEQAAVRTAKRDERLHPDDAATFLGHALAMVLLADVLASTPRADLAARLYRRTLAMRPDDLDLVVRLDALAGLGLHVPRTNLEARATEGLGRLEGGGG